MAVAAGLSGSQTNVSAKTQRASRVPWAQGGTPTRRFATAQQLRVQYIIVILAKLWSKDTCKYLAVNSIVG